MSYDQLVQLLGSCNSINQDRIYNFVCDFYFSKRSNINDICSFHSAVLIIDIFVQSAVF